MPQKRNKKRAFAMKMMTPMEVRAGISPYSSLAWMKRQDAIKAKVAKQGQPKKKSKKVWISKRKLKAKKAAK